jgi:predicted DNA-binding protein (MmcQ/YjbR family)
MSNELAILKKLRALCLALPETSETVSFGHPTFQVAKKTFCVLEPYKGELCIVFKAELPTQQALIQSPRFFTAPYIGKHGWVSLRCSSKLDWGEIEDLVGESHRLVAAKTRAHADRASKKNSSKRKPTKEPRARRA